MNKELLKLHAEFCKIFSNPLRLEILCLLKAGELTAGDITEKLGVRKANTSQHLTLMRMEQILTARRDGIHVYYGIADEKICEACSLMLVGLERIFGDAGVEKRKGIGIYKESRYDQNNKKCIDHVLS